MEHFVDSAADKLSTSSLLWGPVKRRCRRRVYEVGERLDDASMWTSELLPGREKDSAKAVAGVVGCWHDCDVRRGF